MEAVGKPVPSCIGENYSHEDGTVQNGTETDWNVKKGCTAITHASLENNADIPSLETVSKNAATSSVYSNEACLDNHVNTCDTNVNSRSMICDDSAKFKMEGNQISTATVVDPGDLDFSNTAESVVDKSSTTLITVPGESDLNREESHKHIDDSMTETLSVDDTNSKPFCDMSELAYVADIVLQTPANTHKRTQTEKNVSSVATGDELLEKASKQLGRRLVALEYDSSATEDSNTSTSEQSSSSTESSSSSSSSSDMSDEEELSNIKQLIDYDESEGVHHQPPKTKDEILPQVCLARIPDLEEVLCSDLPEGAELLPVGQIQSFVELMLVVKAYKNTPALDADTVFFRKDKKPFGKVYDVFGPVQDPFYVLRYGSEEKFKSMGLAVGDTAYYAPDYLDLTKPVFVEQLKKMKGSDASWKHDQEPPPECLDYSDDEEEARAKANAKKKRQNDKKQFMLEETANDADGEDEMVLKGKIPKEEKKHFNVRGHQIDRAASTPGNFIGESLHVRQPHSTVSPSFRPLFGEPRFAGNGFRAGIPVCPQEQVFMQPNYKNATANVDLQNVNKSLNGDVQEQRDDFMHTEATEKTATEQISTISGSGMSLDSSDQNHLPQSVFSLHDDMRAPRQHQCSPFRLRYTFPFPPPPPRFDPTVPPPALPPGMASNLPPNASPGIGSVLPRRFYPPTVRNPAFSPPHRQIAPNQNAPPPNWR